MITYLNNFMNFYWDDMQDVLILQTLVKICRGISKYGIQEHLL